MPAKFKLEIDLNSVPQDQRKAHVARLLRSAADRVEGGHDCGGFHLSREDSTDGGFVLYHEVDRQPSTERRPIRSARRG